MSSPRVSVIVPVRNRRELLARTLAALAAQTVTDHEVVVVDDGSTDASAAVAEEAAAAGQPVRVLRTGGAGAVAARSAGVAAARADVLAFTDSDCEPTPGWLAAGLAAIDAGADVVQGRTVPARPYLLLEHTIAVGDLDGLWATCNVFYRRAAFDEARGFDPDLGRRYGFRPGARLRGLGFGEDSLLGWRVHRRGRGVFAPDAVVAHHVFDVDPVEALRRAWNTGGFPSLVRDVPELRETLLGHRVLLGPANRLPLYAAAGLVPLGRGGRRAAAAALTAWLAVEVRHVHRHGGSRRRQAAILPLWLAAQAVTAASLVLGSARSRTVVL